MAMNMNTKTLPDDEQYTEEYIADKQTELAYDRFIGSQETVDDNDYIEF